MTRKATNPLADFKSALARTAPCKHHDAIRVSQSVEEADLWWETFGYCAEPRRLEHLRWMGQHDLFFLLVHMLKRTHLHTQFHFDRCKEIVHQSTNMVDIWFRESGKSELMTYGQNIRDVLNDPNISIGIFSHSRPLAKGFLRLIKQEFEMNELLKSVYPDILFSDPVKQSPKWSEDEGIVVKRTTIRKESTIEAWGLIDGQPTGKRFQILDYDDVVSRRETSVDMIEKATREFENSLALTAADPPQFRYTATYQEIGDTTHQLIQRKFAPVRRYPVVDGEGKPVLFSEEKLAWLKSHMSPKVFALQYLLDCETAASDSQLGFDLQWMRRERTQPDLPSLSIYLLVDPAGKSRFGNSRFAAGVLGVDCHKNWHWLDGVLDKLNLSERGDATLGLWKKWHPLKIGYETYGMQGDIEYIHERAKNEGLQITVVPLKGAAEKDARIETLIPVFKEGHFFVPENGLWYNTKEGQRINLVEEFVQKEYTLWPYTQYKDQLDMLARIRDPGLGVVYPRAYGSASTTVRNPWGQAGQAGSWLSE